MPLRLIETITGKAPNGEPRQVRVKHDPDWQEYVCQVTDRGARYPAADYHSDDKADAIATARHMAGLEA